MRRQDGVVLEDPDACDCGTFRDRRSFADLRQQVEVSVLSAYNLQGGKVFSDDDSFFGLFLAIAGFIIGVLGLISAVMMYQTDPYRGLVGMAVMAPTATFNLTVTLVRVTNMLGQAIANGIAAQAPKGDTQIAPRVRKYK